MKKILCFMAMLLCIATGHAQRIMDGQVEVKNINVARSGDQVLIGMDVDVSALQVKSNREVILIPAIKAGEAVQELPAIRVMGRNRHYWHQRNRTLFDEGEYAYRKGQVSEVNYSAKIPFEPWMEKAEIVMSEEFCGCGGETLDAALSALQDFDISKKVFAPHFVFVQPEAEAVKTRELTGSAFIDFPVNRTEIYPDYRKNPEELQKIRNTIDVVKNDADTRIVAITLKGYASPEGSYKNNIRLAKGRTATLKEYVQQQYAFPDTLMAMDYEPEDWEGLRRYVVAASNLADRDGILALIDSDLEPDPKNETIRRRYPQTYAFLLKECYPALRHSDYTVRYVIRAYTDVNEACEVFRTSPGKLSLQELYMVAGSYEVGSKEYCEVFETAARIYPGDEVANLNAANVVMGRGDLEGAKRYLDKAGQTAQAVYARGIYEAMNQRYAEAKALFEEAEKLGVTEAVAALEQIDKLSNNN